MVGGLPECEFSELEWTGMADGMPADVVVMMYICKEFHLPKS